MGKHFKGDPGEDWYRGPVARLRTRFLPGQPTYALTHNIPLVLVEEHQPVFTPRQTGTLVCPGYVHRSGNFGCHLLGSPHTTGLPHMSRRPHDRVYLAGFVEPTRDF